MSHLFYGDKIISSAKNINYVAGNFNIIANITYCF